MKRIALGCVLAALALAGPAPAQEIPKKSITLMVGFAAGGAADPETVISPFMLGAWIVHR